MINLFNVDKYFNKGKRNEIHVINETTISLPDSGLISFTGNSGSGKTTLLNVLGGLDRFNGNIEYDDNKFNGYEPKKIDEYRKKNIGYIFQNYYLLLDETVYDNLKIALNIIGVTDKDEVKRRIEYTLKAVGMFKYRKKMAYALSGGQQQRVSIARALIKNSKIIIADEPTGNLDKKNTIEVMNILKKISQKSLVLLVTHNTNMARKYSDKVYSVIDGITTLKDKSDLNSVRESGFENTIYLKDLNLENVNSSLGEIKLYSDKESLNDLGLTIISKDSRIIIKSSKEIRFSKDDNIELIDEHFNEVDTSVINEINDYDTSFFKDTKEKDNFKSLFSKFKEAYNKTFKVSRKTKSLFVVLFFIGMVLALSIIAYINSIGIDKSEVKINDNYSSLYTETFEYSERTVIDDLYNNDLLSDIIVPFTGELSFTKQVSYYEQSEVKFEYYILPFIEEDINLVYGSAPKEIEGNSRELFEVVINIKEAEEIIKKCNLDLSYEEFIGIKITINNFLFRICGLTDTGSNCGYVSYDDFEYISFYSNDARYSFTRYGKKEMLNGEYLYEVVRGRDVDYDSTNIEVLIPDEPEYEELGYPTSISIGRNSLKVVGTYKYKYDVINTYISNREILYNHKYNHIGCLSKNEYMIIEGRDFESSSECIANVHSDYKIGETYKGKTIVGLYTGSTLATDYHCLSTLDSAMLSLAKEESKKLIFKVKDLDKSKEIAKNYNYFVDSIENNQINVLKLENDKLSSFVFKIIFVVLFIISLVFIYLIMRSKMISEIYSIGVYRSLGAPRKYVFKKFLSNVIIISIFTSIVGYLIVSIIYSIVELKVNSMFSREILFNNYLLLGLGMILLFVSLVFFGMISIINLLRKTPSEIATKYDI